MLRKEQNDLLTQTGPGTPGGKLFRSYWLPALLAEELPENECPPVRVKLLSERLLAFRDTQGRYGLIDEFCAHRGVSLWFGRNEDNGLRCPYHGWKYDHTGQCIEVPRSPRKAASARRSLKSIRWSNAAVLRTYSHLTSCPAAGMGIRHGSGGPELRVEARAGEQLAAGHGSASTQPRVVSHRGDLNSDPPFRGQGQPVQSQGPRPVFERSRARALYRRAPVRENGHYYWRITQWVMPSSL